MSKKSRIKTAKAAKNPKDSPKRPESTQTTVRSISVEEFVRRLRAESNADKRFALFLGAGCSVSSGIPAAGALVRDRWIPRLHAFLAPDRKDVDVWVKEVIGMPILSFEGHEHSNFEWFESGFVKSQRALDITH
jgi:hypothetical protein